MSFDENTQTMSVGTHDWLEASEDMHMRAQSYLPPVGGAEIAVDSVESPIRFTIPSHELPITLTERFNEAYDEDARREDAEFFRTTRAYYRRRFNRED